MSRLQSLQKDEHFSATGAPPTCLLTVAEVAMMLGFSTAAVYREVRRGNLNAYSLCGRLRIAPAALAEWLDARAVPAPVTAVDRKTSARHPANPRGLLRPLRREDAQR